jgi:hypothetical protein
MEKDKSLASTELLWIIANKDAFIAGGEKQDKFNTLGDVTDVLNVMYPGINYYWTETMKVAWEIASKDVNKQHPLLTTFAKAADATKELGKTLNVSKVKNCKGYEWENWL